MSKPELKIKGKVTSEFSEILTPPALSFVQKLEENFSSQRLELLKKKGRETIQN